MTFPVVAVSRPAVLEGQANGRLSADILVVTPGQMGGPFVRLVEPAARAWRAMCAAALEAGIVLKASGPTDSFRPYEVQERIFLQRYTTTPLAGRPTRTWQGRTYWQKPGTAAAAVPGTSNHGWGLAVDTGVETDGDPGTESIDATAIDWLRENAHLFGFSWELQSEPWHLRYFSGDRIPAAVLAYEQSEPEEDDMTPEESALLKDVQAKVVELHTRMNQLTMEHNWIHIKPFAETFRQVVREEVQRAMGDG